MCKLKAPVFLFFSFLILNSCVGKRKIAKLNKAIENQTSVEKKLDATLSSLNDFRNEKNTIGELDDSSSVSIKKVIDKESAASKSRLFNFKEMQAKLSGKKVKRKVYKNMVSIVSLGDSIVATTMETVDFVDQLLKQETFIKFNTATFFPPGGYIIDAEKRPEAKKVFSPLVDSLISFVNKFPKYTLRSSIVSSGFADGQGFSPGELVNTLSANIGKAEPSKEELNIELSRLRAEEIAGILEEILKEKINLIKTSSSLNTRFFKTGKGEEFPNKKIKDYQIDDERRRIVIIYWNALPTEN